MKSIISTILAATIILGTNNIADAREHERKHTPIKRIREATRGLINRTATRLPIRKNKINYVEMGIQPTIRLTSKSCANGNCPIQTYDF